MDWWSAYSNGKKVTIVATALLIIAILFWNPFTRQVILFLLPLGSGFDDIIFIFCLVAGGVLMLIRFLAGKKMD